MRVTDHAARVKSGKADRDKALDELDEGDPQTALVFAILDVAAAVRGLRASTSEKHASGSVQAQRRPADGPGGPGGKEGLL
jgi:hypothetical protein